MPRRRGRRSRQEEKAIHAYYGVLGEGAKRVIPPKGLLKHAAIILRDRESYAFDEGSTMFVASELTDAALDRLRAKKAWKMKSIDVLDPAISTTEPIAEARVRRVGKHGEKAYISWFGSMGAHGPESRRPLPRKKILLALQEFARQNPDIDLLFGDRTYDPEKVPKHQRRKLERGEDPHSGELYAKKEQTINLARIRRKKR
jgi:hypothetical protein